MRIMLTGAGGMLGRDLTDILAKQGGRLLQACDHATLDVQDFSAVQAALAGYHPELLIHLAAYTDVEKAEGDADAVYRTNYLGTWYVCQACAMLDITLVYLSSDLVFDGKKGLPYLETDRRNPLNVYGRSKLAGEDLVRNLVRRHYIIRAGWMFGGRENDHKFAGRLMEQAKAGNTLHVVNDCIGSPIYTRDLAEKIREIIMDGLPWGTYHVVNRGSCSRYEFALEILSLAGYADLTVIPVAGSYFPGAAPRPLNSALRNYALELMGRNDLRSWQEALEDYITAIPGERESR